MVRLSEWGSEVSSPLPPLWIYTEAQRKANTLLLSMLTPRQRDDYLLLGYFTVVGSAGNRYRIRYGDTYNVSWVSRSGITLGVFCAHPRLWSRSRGDSGGLLPTQDVMLGQMLTLVDNEWAFLRKANKSFGQWPPGQKHTGWDRFFRLLIRIAAFPL